MALYNQHVCPVGNWYVSQFILCLSLSFLCEELSPQTGDFSLSLSLGLGIITLNYQTKSLSTKLYQQFSD